MLKLNNKDDDELICLITQNNSKALDFLFKRYYQRLCNFAYRFVKNVEISEEVVSDIFLNIWLKRFSLKINSSARAYLYTAVKNQAINYIIKNDSYDSFRVTLSEEEENEAENIEHNIEFEELLNQVDEIIKRMPEKRQLVFRMSRIDGLHYKEISEILSISVNTVQNHIVEAVKFIAKQRPKLKN